MPVISKSDSKGVIQTCQLKQPSVSGRFVGYLAVSLPMNLSKKSNKIISMKMKFIMTVDNLEILEKLLNISLIFGCAKVLHNEDTARAHNRGKA